MRLPLPISLHVQDFTDQRVGLYVAKVLPAFQQANFPFWIKVLDPPMDAPDWASGVDVLGRMFELDGISWADMANGAPGAVNFYNRWRDHWLARPWVKCWTIGNEPHPPGDIDFLKKLNEFMVRMSELMRPDGLLPAGPNMSVGWPDIGHAKYLGDGIQAMYRFVLHEYSAPAMWTTASWHCGRYRRTVGELAEAGFTHLPPALFGETGIDGGVKPVYKPKTGWRTHAASEEEYVQQLRWQAEMHLDDYPLVEGAFMFTVAAPGWGWSDFTPTDKLLDLMALDVVVGYEVDDEPEPPPPPPFEILDVSGELPVHPVKVYEIRDWAYGGAVIHHAGYAYPANATAEQVRAHLDVIAKYHVNKRDWPGIAYHFVVDGAGRIWQVNALDAITYHSGNDSYNEQSVGICMLGAFHLDTDPTPAQLLSVNCLCQWLEIGGDDIFGHKQIVATACPGKMARWWDAITVPDDRCEEEEEQEDGVITVIDRNGNLLDWTFTDICEQFGVDMYPATPPKGETVYRLRQVIYDGSGETNWRMYVKDPNGAPVRGVACFLGILPPSGQELPPNAAPRLAVDFWQQPGDRPNRALVHTADNSLNFTGVHGYIQHSLGGGSNYVPPGPASQWCWVMPGDLEEYTDVFTGIGMFHNHEMFWPVFEKTVVGGGNGPVDPPPGGYVVEVPEIDIIIPAFNVVVRPAEET
jgi:hypothetical protein